jgi:predicted transcriptional regulator
LYSLSNYFDKIINDEKEDNYKTAKKIKKEIRKFLEDNPISI